MPVSATRFNRLLNNQECFPKYANKKVKFILLHYNSTFNKIEHPIFHFDQKGYLDKKIRQTAQKIAINKLMSKDNAFYKQENEFT